MTTAVFHTTKDSETVECLDKNGLFLHSSRHSYSQWPASVRSSRERTLKLVKSPKIRPHVPAPEAM